MRHMYGMSAAVIHASVVCKAKDNQITFAEYLRRLVLGLVFLRIRSVVWVVDEVEPVTNE